MARYRGPRRRVVRRLQTALTGLTSDLPGEERKPYPPGQHGPSRRRIRLSDYAIRLREKQKLVFYYGLTETQIRKYVSRASHSSRDISSFLESRLDNMVYRLGLAPTIPAARQLVNHGHILVNGRRVDIPSYEVAVGDTIRVREKSQGHSAIRAQMQKGPELIVSNYLSRDDDGLGGKCIARPSREDSPIDFEETLVTEYYAAH